jgi:hypothetical protein
MALLTQPVQAQSSFPQVAQQYAAIKDKERDMANSEARRLRSEQEKAEAQRRKTAAERGDLISGVTGLKSNPSLSGIGQSIYDDYLKAEDSGNVEEAEAIKSTLEKFLTAGAGYVKSEQNVFNKIMNDPTQASLFNDSPEQIAAVFDQSIRKNYQLKREGSSYFVAGPDGQEYDLFAMPELRGESFVSYLNPKSIIPDFENSTNFGERHANSILNRNDVTNEMGRIKNPARVLELLNEELDIKITQSPQVLDGIIYAFQKARGEMDSYDQEKINRLKENNDFVSKVRQDYIDNGAATIKAYERIKIKEQPKSKWDELIENTVVYKGGDGKMAADYSTAGKQLQYLREENGQSIMANITKIIPSEAGVTVMDTVPVDANGNPTTPANAQGYGVKPRVIRRGSDEWNVLSAQYGGEKNFMKLLRKLDPGIQM